MTHCREVGSSLFRGWIVFAAIVAMLAGAISAAKAQDHFDAHVADIIVLEPKQVQAAIGITPKQRAQMTRYVADHTKAVRAFIADKQKKGINPNSISASDPTAMAMLDTLKMNIVRTLTPSQLRRLREITLQARGYAELLDPMVDKRLAVTPAQLKSIRDILERFARYAQGATQDAYIPIRTQYANIKPKDQADADRLRGEFTSKVRAAEDAVRPQIVQAHRQMDISVEAVLTRSQRADWIALLGPTFKAK